MAFEDRKSVVVPHHFDIDGFQFKIGIWEIFNGAQQYEIMLIHVPAEGSGKNPRVLAAKGATENFTKQSSAAGNPEGTLESWNKVWIDTINNALDLFFEDKQKNPEDRVPRQDEMEEAFNFFLEHSALVDERFVAQ